MVPEWCSQCFFLRAPIISMLEVFLFRRWLNFCQFVETELLLRQKLISLKQSISDGNSFNEISYFEKDDTSSRIRTLHFSLFQWDSCYDYMTSQAPLQIFFWFICHLSLVVDSFFVHSCDKIFGDN